MLEFYYEGHEWNPRMSLSFQIFTLVVIVEGKVNLGVNLATAHHDPGRA